MKTGLIFSILLAFSVNLFGAFESFTDFDARTRAIANANASLPISGSVIVVNPALLPNFGKRLIQLSVLPRGLGLDLGANSMLMNLSGAFILPIKKGKLITTESGFGFALNSLLVNNDSSASYYEFQVSAAYGVRLDPKVSFGITAVGQYFMLAPGAEALPAGYTPLPVPNMNVGFHFAPYDQVSIGLVGMNLLKPNISGLSDSSTNQDNVGRAIVLGVAYSIQRFVIALDTHFLIDSSTFNLKFGGETFFFGRRFHAGVGLEMLGPTRSITPSIGFGGVVGPLVIDYALSYPLNLGGLGNHIFSVTLAF